MTELEQEMLDAIRKAERYDEEQEAKNCAQVAREWISRAIMASKYRDDTEEFSKDYVKDL